MKRHCCGLAFSCQIVSKDLFSRNAFKRVRGFATMMLPFENSKIQKIREKCCIKKKCCWEEIIY
jgi:hypothetical protein